MKPLEPLQEKLYNEIVGRIKQTDLSVPYRSEGYYYYFTRFEEGKDYPVYCRKKGSLEGAEEVLLNVNEMAQGHDYYSVGGLEVSPNNMILSYGVDTVSRRKYTLHFKNLATGEILPDAIVNTTGSAAWADDNKTVFYTQIDDTTLRPQKIFRHVLGTPVESDVLIFHEADETFNVDAYKTKSKKYIFIASSNTLSNEYRFIPADKPTAEFKVFQPRERDLEYDVDHYQDKFYVRTNMGAKNFRLMTAALDKTGKADWVELIPNRDDVFLEGFELFKGALVLEERKNGLIQIRVMPWDKSPEHYLDFGEATYSAWISTNPEFDTEWLRYGYTSLTTPMSTFDYNMVTHEKKLLKQEEVLGGFDAANYQAERLYAAARDGVKVPVSLVYRKGFVKDGDGALPALRLRVVRREHGRRLRLGPPEPPRPGVRLRHRPHPGRAGDGPGLVRGRQAPQEEEHLHRLHRLRRVPRGPEVHEPRPGSSPRAGARAGCSWAPSSTCVRTSSRASSSACPSSTSSRPCSTSRSR